MTVTAGPRGVGGRYFVQNPGPTNIPDRVLEAFRRPAIDFSDPDFIALADSVWTELPEVFGGADEIVVLTTVGHGAWESALTNTLDPGDAVLIPDCGLFGKRWAMMARDLGYEVVSTSEHLRSPTDPAEIADILAADTSHRIRNVCIVHTETSTGSVTDLAAMRAAIDAAGHPALFVVDGVCSLGIEPLR
ncbi:MAG: aminotransferase class V-fold PLP-dependent enzyme, partial [Acidimicrobiaceae bacterium]|nr:aminotransferase class V-fold PLP-dependent enzyme [Acidimicrobiaceae bacterium]